MNILRYKRHSLPGLAFIVLTLSMALSACAQSQPLEERFQEELTALHAQYRFPGATAAYVLKDGSTGKFAVGLADVESATAMTPQSRMLAASIGKTFVGATILALAADGILELDDPISKWLGDRPWFDRLPNHDAITLRQLLQHSSGIPNHVEAERFAASFSESWRDTHKTSSPEELIAFVLDSPPLFAAGKDWSYTDTGYLLLGLVIENTTGQSWYDEVDRRFLKPLNLSRTSPSDRVTLPDLAAGYMSKDNPFGLPAKTISSPGLMVWNPAIESSGGGFVSNPEDLAIWGKALYEGEAIQGEYMDDLLESVPVGGEGSPVRYGAAVAIHTGGISGPTYGHSGWIPGYCSSLRYYPDLEVAVAFQINTDIGIVDGSSEVMEEMEKRLVAVLAANAKQ